MAAMSTATQVPPSDSSKYVDYDEFIDFQVQKTRAGIKTNDLLTALVGGSTAVLAYVLVFALFDHWIIDGGFGRGMRFVLLGLLVTVLSGWCVWKLVLPYFRKVSALYAAREIEDAEPEFRSTLVTLVDLKRAGREVSPEIRAVLEKRAGLGLTHMDVEQAVDRRLLMRLSYVLLGLVVVTCLYTVFSPKNLSNSLWRALLPAASVAVDTRTEINRVQPGDVEVLARSQLEVTADLSGEMPDEVTLLYSTSDNRLVDEPIAMRETDEGLRQYRGIITGENGRGVLQNLTYRVVAGDATSSSYTVTVKQPPSATVEEVQYDFPDYMQFRNRTQVGGAIDAYEGTEVTVRATANMPITSALLRYSDTEDISNKAEEFPVNIENGTQLSVTLRLKFRSDGTKPNFYHILCRNDAGEEDPNPTLYPIKITADDRPEIDLLHPTTDIERPANAVVPLRFAASDDFKLRTIVLHLEQNGERLPQAPRLFEAPPERRSVSGIFNFDLSELVLSPGDLLTYKLEARDNLQPFDNRNFNQKFTKTLRITIVEAATPEEVQQQLEEDQQQIDDQLAEEGQQPRDGQGSPPPADDEEDGETPPPPSNDEPQQGEQAESQPTEAGEPSEAGEQSGGESGESGDQQQQKQGSGEGQERQSGEESDGAGEQQSKQPGQGGQEGEEEAPFEEVLERLMKEERQRQQNNPDQENSAQENAERQRGEQQPRGDSPEPGDRSTEREESAPEDATGESSESQSGEAGERSSQEGESSSSQSPSSTNDDSQSDPNSGTSPSDPQSENSGDGPPQGADPSESMSENPPVREGETAGGEPTETESSPSPGSESNSTEPSGAEGEPTPSNDAQPGDPMPGEPKAGKPNSGQPGNQGESENSRPTPDGTEGDPSPASDPMSGDPAEGAKPAGDQPNGEPGDSRSPMPPQGDQGNTPPGTSKSPSESQKRPSGPHQGTPKEPSDSAPPGDATGEKPPSAEKGQPPGDQTPGEGQPMPGGNEGTPQEGQAGGEGEQSGEGKSANEGGEPPEGEQQPGGEQEGGSPQGGGEQAGGEQPGGSEGGGAKGGGSEGESAGGPQQGAGQPESPGQGQSSGGESTRAGNGGGNMAPSGTEGSTPGGAGEGNAPGDAGPGEGGEGTADNIQGDSPDLESKRKAANLVLKRLEEQLQRGEIDPALREELGVTDDQLQEFTQRLKQRLADTGEDNSPEAKARRQQFNETLRNLEFDSTGTARDGGDGPRESTGGFAGPQRRPPARRRDATEAYQREINRRKKSK